MCSSTSVVSIPQAVSTVATNVTSLEEGVVAGFNTASGKHCCNWSINAELPLMLLYTGFNTASGKHCCNFNYIKELTIEFESFNTASGKHCCNRIQSIRISATSTSSSFNTASGKHCCNDFKNFYSTVLFEVSIPQAVSTVATLQQLPCCFYTASLCFNTASGKHCCNKKYNKTNNTTIKFQYRKR